MQHSSEGKQTTTAYVNGWINPTAERGCVWPNIIPYFSVYTKSAMLQYFPNQLCMIEPIFITASPPLLHLSKFVIDASTVAARDLWRLSNNGITSKSTRCQQLWLNIWNTTHACSYISASGFNFVGKVQLCNGFWV